MGLSGSGFHMRRSPAYLHVHFLRDADNDPAIDDVGFFQVSEQHQAGTQHVYPAWYSLRKGMDPDQPVIREMRIALPSRNAKAMLDIGLCLIGFQGTEMIGCEDTLPKLLHFGQC
jgi:hypothetical protein